MRRMALIAAVVVAALVFTGCMPRQPWRVELLSVNAAGTASGNHQSGYLGWVDYDISPDGTQVLFASEASDLVADDANGKSDLFLRDLATDTTTLVTTNAAGTGSANGSSYDGRFSADGTKLLFRSEAGDFGPNDTNGSWDIYVKDLVSGTTTLVSVNSVGTNSGNGYSYQGSFSGDGMKVAFDSYASNLDPTHSDTNGQYDVYVRDLVAGTTTLASPDASGTAAAGASVPLFSPDGTKVAFESWETTFGPPDAGVDLDLYVRDLTTATTALVSANSDGTDGGDVYVTQGRWRPDSSGIMFTSAATNLVANDTNGRNDVFLRDVATGTTSLLSANAAGTASANGFSSGASFDATGDRVVFTSSANDLGPTDTGPYYDAYVRDLATGETTLVSRNVAGTGGGTGHVYSAVFNPEGTMVAFVGGATDYIPDGPTYDNLYVADLATGTITMASPNADGTGGVNNPLLAPRFVPGSSQLVFLSFAFNLDPRDMGSGGDVYLTTYEAADLGVSITAAPEPAQRLDALTYTVTVDNAGPDPAEDADLAIALPEDVAFEDVTTDAGSCTGPTTEQPQLVRCDLDDIADGGEATITVSTTVPGSAGASFEAKVRVVSATADMVSDNNERAAHTTVVGQGP